MYSLSSHPFLEIASKDLVSEFAKFLALQRLRVEIPDHVIGWAIFNCDVAFLDLVREKEVTYIQRSGPLARAFLAICLQQNSTFVVLVQYIPFNLVALCLQEQLRP